MPYHVMIWPASPEQQHLHELYALDLSQDQLRQKFIEPYDKGTAITWNGRTLPPGDISYIRIYESSGQLGPRRHEEYEAMTPHPEVTNDWITGAPGHAAERAATVHPKRLTTVGCEPDANAGAQGLRRRLASPLRSAAGTPHTDPVRLCGAWVGSFRGE
jgi:hypothetical protein